MIEAVLNSSFPRHLSDALLRGYRDMERHYSLHNWKTSELDAGHFVEAVRRALEHKLFGSYTPIGENLPLFNDAELKRYEQAHGDVSYRVLIPQVLKTIANIRNKRGVGHLGVISPNEMDATYIVYASKWVLAELVRLNSDHTPSETEAAIGAVIERRLGVIWKHGGIARVLADNLTARQQILVLLHDRSPQTEDELRSAVEYKNPTNFRSILSGLHRERLIEYSRGRPIHLSPKGAKDAEELILRAQTHTR